MLVVNVYDYLKIKSLKDYLPHKNKIGIKLIKNVI